MPNWCDNTLYITGCRSEAAALRALMTTSKSKFDFRAIVPMPAEIERSELLGRVLIASSLTHCDWQKIKHLFGLEEFATCDAALQAVQGNGECLRDAMSPGGNPSTVATGCGFDELADNAPAGLPKCGRDDWYSWCCDNWGTEWPAHAAGWMSSARAAKREAHQIAYFETAWSPPVPVVLALSARFPKVVLRLEYDEPDGGIRGSITVQAGSVIAEKREKYNVMEEYVLLCHNLHERDRGRGIVYIGHGRSADSNGPEFSTSRWANPFATHDRTGAQAVDLYRRWLMGEPGVVSMLPSDERQRPSLDEIREQLRGKTLLCDCQLQTDECHGHVLLRFACGWDGEHENTDEDERDPAS